MRGTPVNRCPVCGGIANTVEIGEYECTNGITRMTRTKNGMETGIVEPCGARFKIINGRRSDVSQEQIVVATKKVKVLRA